VYTYPEKPEKNGYHCVIIYGWDERGWLVQNSWGKSWGQGGRFVVPFDFKWAEAWAVTDNVVNGESLIKPQDNWFIWAFSKFINWLLNLFHKNK
jgi:C1A family cysteine protease